MGEICSPLRKRLLLKKQKVWQWLGKMLSCPQCLGFWVGFGVAFLWPLGLPLEEEWMCFVAQGAISSGVCLLLSGMLLWFGWE